MTISARSANPAARRVLARVAMMPGAAGWSGGTYTPRPFAKTTVGHGRPRRTEVPLR